MKRRVNAVVFVKTEIGVEKVRIHTIINMKKPALVLEQINDEEGPINCVKETGSQMMM
jgi:hypothetical protein